MPKGIDLRAGRCNLPLKQHAALVSLVRLGRLGICIGTRDGKHVEILARLN